IGAPIPQPDPTAVAWMKAEQSAPRERPSLVKRPLQLLKSGPTDELLTAARTGAPNLEPESNEISAADMLKPGGQTKLVGTGGGTTGIVATVTTGGTGTAESTGASENVAPSANEGGATVGAVGEPAPADPPKNVSAEPAAAATPPTPEAAKSDAAAKNPPEAGSAPESPANGAPTASGADAKSDTTAAGAAKTSDAASSDKSKDKDKKESSSKKKKGLHKLVPW
ncbi:MAG: hypothetical protein ACRD51_09840, partial [Candidatus Acidiferrum sp.]